MPTENKRWLLVDLLCVVGLIALCLVIAWPRWRAGIDWGDEGFLAYGAVRVMDGQIPHRDFVSLQPPLSFYTAAGVFKLFGTSLASLRILGLSIFLLIPLLLYGIGRSLTKPTLWFAAAVPACLLGLPLFNFVPFAVWQGITASLAAVLLYMHALLRNRRWLAFPAGILTAASLFLRHDQALYSIMALVVLTVAMKFATRDSDSPPNFRFVIVLWLTGAAVVFAPALIYFGMQGALPEMFQQLLIFPLTTYGKTSSLPFPNFTAETTIAAKAAAIFFFIPPIVQAIAAIWLTQRLIRRQFYRREAVLTFLLVWSALFYLQALTRSDLNHLLITLPPFFLLAAYCWRILLRACDEWRILKIVMSILAATAVAGFLLLISSVSLADITEANDTLAVARGGVRIEKAQFIIDLIRKIQSDVPAARSILCLPYQPMFYFLSERRNPTRWNYLWPGDQTPRDHERLIEQAKADPPGLILLTREDNMSSYATPILDYVHRDYTAAGNYGALTAYLPQNER